MKIVQSLWSKPIRISWENCQHDNSQYDRFISYMKFSLSAQALSVILLRKQFEEVTLYTDDFAYNTFYKFLDLPYTNVEIILDEINFCSSSIWALGKMFLYSKITSPFLHIDNDFFAFKNFPRQLLNSELIVQSYESDLDHFYTKKSSELIESYPSLEKFSPQVKDPNDRWAINAGILGGYNTTFINEFFDYIYSFIATNHLSLKHDSDYNMVFEQMFFYSYALQNKISISPLYDENNIPLIDFNKFYDLDFIHPCGVSKKFYFIKEQVYLHLNYLNSKLFNQINNFKF